VLTLRLFKLPFFRSVPIAKSKQQLQGKMLKFFVIFALFSSIFCAASKNIDNKHKILCDLNSFICKCGDIDVVTCKCSEWSKDCPEHFVYNEEVCGCIEGTRNVDTKKDSKGDTEQKKDSETIQNPADQPQGDNSETIKKSDHILTTTISEFSKKGSSSDQIIFRAHRPIGITKITDTSTTRTVEISSSYDESTSNSKETRELESSRESSQNRPSESSKEYLKSSTESIESSKYSGSIKERLEPPESSPESSDKNSDSSYHQDNNVDPSESSVSDRSETLQSRSEFADNIETRSQEYTSSDQDNDQSSDQNIDSHYIDPELFPSDLPSVLLVLSNPRLGSDSLKNSKYSSDSSNSGLEIDSRSKPSESQSFSSDVDPTPSFHTSSSPEYFSSIFSESHDVTAADSYPTSTTNLNPTLTSSNDSCYIPECRSCDELDQENCICYQVEMECLPGFTTSADGCECIRDNTTSISEECPGLVCTDGLSVNEAFCNCSHKICSSAPACKDKFLLNLETCECVCGLMEWNCQKSFVINQEKCLCEPPPCKPFFPCPDETHWDFDLCTCVCSNPPNCTSDKYVVDVYSCKCVCANQECDVGYIIDELTCECVSDHEPVCPSKFVYDPMLCRCICQAYSECPFNFQWDESLCKCVCPKSVICNDDFLWSDQHCDCICNVNKTCQPNFVFDNKKCDCVCDPKLNDDVCEVGHIFDKRICDCVKGTRPQCPAGFVYSEEQCDCVCAVVEKCTGKGIFDHDTCKCVCLEERIKCDFGILDKEECDCVSGLPIDFFGGNWDED